MNLWQQVAGDDQTYQTVGRYVAGPGQRLRLELHVQVGKTRGELRLISDGTILQQVLYVGGDAPELAQFALPPAAGPDAAAERERFLQEQGFAGVGPLLQALRRRLQNLRADTLKWHGLEVLRVTGDWTADPAHVNDIMECLRPRVLPRQCCIYLDAVTLWPHRLEWWGPGQANGPPALLLQTEFRDAVLNRPLPPDRCAREFALAPPPPAAAPADPR
jgi:hypothetical protein